MRHTAGDETYLPREAGAGDRSGGVRRVAKRKTHLEAEDALEGRRCIGRWKMHWKAEDASEGGGCVGRRKMRWKAEEASEAEAEFEMERCGGRGFPLQLPPLQDSIASMRACQNPLERTLHAS